MIALLFGCYDIVTILLMGSINACMNFFGLLMEEMNIGKAKKEKSWVPFYYGCFAGLFPWIGILFYFFGGG